MILKGLHFLNNINTNFFIEQNHVFEKYYEYL